MEPYTDPTPWVNPTNGDRYAELPTDENGRPVQGLIRIPRTRDEFVADAD